jgi:hypothetical protein
MRSGKPRQCGTGRPAPSSGHMAVDRGGGRTPLYLTTLVLGLLGAVLVVQPYSGDWPGTAYAEPARRYIRAALRQDSVQLVRLSASIRPVAWALDAARLHGDSLALWGHHIEAWTGELRGDTAEVFVYPPGHGCGEAPIVFRFVGAGKDARVLQASSSCWGR